MIAVRPDTHKYPFENFLRCMDEQLEFFNCNPKEFMCETYDYKKCEKQLLQSFYEYFYKVEKKNDKYIVRQIYMNDFKGKNLENNVLTYVPGVPQYLVKV